MRRHVLIGSMSLLLFVVGCGNQRQDELLVARSLQPIEGGELDYERVSVVGMSIDLGIVDPITGEAYSGLCSGTLIAPNLVLTARHCVSTYGDESVICGQADLGTPISGAKVYVTTDLHMSNQGRWYRGSQVLVPSQGSDVCGYDMALVILSESLPSSVAVPYVPRIDVPPEISEPYVAVGYGNVGAADSYGARMERHDLTVQCELGACGSLVRTTEFRGETGICQGDSGGPALDVENRVMGVASRTAEAGCLYPVYGSVSAWSDWMREGAMRAAELGEYEAPRWAVTGSSVPEEIAPVLGGQGDACSANLACGNGLLCAYETTPDTAFCTARCDASTACPSGLACRTDIAACMTPPSAGDDGGCSVLSGDRGPAKPVPWLVGFALAALSSLRRRRGGISPRSAK